MPRAPKALRPLIAKSTWRGWVYVVLGGALLTPFLIGTMFVTELVGALPLNSPTRVGVMFFVLFSAIGLAGLLRPVRAMEGAAAKELLGAPDVIGACRAWSDRLRTSAWFAGHLLGGGAFSLAAVLLPTAAGWLLTVPFRAGELQRHFGLGRGWSVAWLPAAGFVMIVVLIYIVAGAVAVATRLALPLLGPSRADRLAELEQRAQTLAERNRLARELHDSVGHALSIITVQAGAAGRVLHGDRDFAERALTAIEESARGALEDLDHVLGLLRDDRPATAPQPTLKDLDRLLDKTRMAGTEVACDVEGGTEQVPAAVSREAYRIVQEGLTNALKHAGVVPIKLRLAVRTDRLELELTNPLGHPPGPARPGGGRGLHGVRERVTVLRGAVTAGPEDGLWRVHVHIPLRSAS
ncbi:MAG TPA: histidine kinase [Streptosporangiaceae bacterium]|jgi:signal transduction histidine kinase